MEEKKNRSTDDANKLPIMANVVEDNSCWAEATLTLWVNEGRGHDCLALLSFF